MSRLYNQRQKDANEAHRIQVKAGFLVSQSQTLCHWLERSRRADCFGSLYVFVSSRVLLSGLLLVSGLHRWGMYTPHSSGKF